MKKRILLPIAALLCLVLLGGCKSAPMLNLAYGFSDEDFSKAQQIVLYDAAGNEKSILTEKPDIEAFIDAINVAGWKLAELPDGLAEGGFFTLWQAETITALLGEHEAKINELCTFRIYENGAYLTIATGIIDLTFTIPESAAEYLRNLTA